MCFALFAFTRHLSQIIPDLDDNNVVMIKLGLAFTLSTMQPLTVTLSSELFLKSALSATLLTVLCADIYLVDRAGVDSNAINSAGSHIYFAHGAGADINTVNGILR